MGNQENSESEWRTVMRPGAFCWVLIMEFGGAFHGPAVLRNPLNVPRMSVLPDACPLRCPTQQRNENSAPPTPSPREMATTLAENIEQRIQKASGLDQPLACAATEAALEGALRVACEEIGSLSVVIESNSSVAFLGGNLDLARITASGVAVGGLRCSSSELTAERVRVDPGSLLSSPPKLPNLVQSVPLRFSLRFSQDDINRSPVLFAAVQELLRELVRSGVSAAIGEVLPAESSSLVISLTKVRTRPLASRVSRMLVFDTPELLSSFEGFGARLEVGLPFLRGAGLSLPEALSLSRLQVDDGAVLVEGELRLDPIDYDDLRKVVDELQEMSRQSPPQAVVVDSEPFSSSSPPDSSPSPELPPASGR